MPISRGQMPRQIYQRGGIMEVAPRQGAIFGGLKKAVSSALGSAKKLLKSDLGKAALLAGGAYFAPTLFGRPAGFGSFGDLIKGGISSLGLDVAPGAKPTLGQFAKVFTIGSLGGAALEALTASGADEEELGNIRDVDTLKAYLRDGYMKLNPGASPMQVDRFVEGQTYEYRANGGRIGFADGMPKEGIETITPMQKPKDNMSYVRDTIKSIDGFAQLIAQKGNLDRKTFEGHMDLFSDFIQRKEIDPMPAYTYLQRRVQELNPEVAKMIYITQEDNPNKMTIERPNRAYGGRIDLRYGGDTMGGKNDKSKSSPGPDRSRVSDRQERSHQAAVREAQAFNRNNTGPASTLSTPPTPPTPKTNIFDKIKNKQAMGIGSLLNKLGNLIFSPVGAAEFDMEAFQKAGADKGFFGGMNDELEAMQEYYDAAKSLTAPGAKFAGANNPQAVRDFITKQSEIPFGGGSYNIDMSLVPKTFLETQQDFKTQKAPISFFNLGGRAGYAFGSPEQNAMEASGIGGLPLNQNPAGITELDLRDSGGFIPPVGVKEKADDIPAMLSNNEFVFTADAVRGMGDGDVEKGAQRMYDMMKKLENGGRV